MKKIVLLLASICIISVTSQAVEAAPRGTPTIVTNDATIPVPVTFSGTLNSTCNSTNYPWKPIGITTQTIAITKTYYAMSVLCSVEFTGSRICTSEELILSPGKVTLPSTVNNALLMSLDTTSFSTASLTGNSTGFPKLLLNGAGTTGDFYNGSGLTANFPVICCAP